MPKVSVVIPAYNCERFISTAIESVLNQTYGDYEIIVVNDGSTDKTDEILSGYTSKIKKIYQPNKGPAEARNTGVANSEGEYIAFLDQDDAWLPDKLRMQVEVMGKNDKLGLVYTDTYILKDKEFSISDRPCRRSFQIRQPHRGSVLEYLFLDNFIATSSVMVRKECFSEIGMFDPSVVPSEDYDRWLRIAAAYEMDFMNVPLVKFRDHIAAFAGNKIVTLTHIIDVLNKALSEYPHLRKILGKRADQRLSYFYVLLGKTYLSKMFFKKAFHSFYIAFKLTGSPLLPFYILFSFIFESFVDILKQVKSGFILGRGKKWRNM
ncbi:MAG: glycosyltransferase family A protein [Candidatus Omnitrophica bacterium]|nr:glycosyltransferase family A protein [Candidatus Omnitrophota bacterium]